MVTIEFRTPKKVSKVCHFGTYNEAPKVVIETFSQSDVCNGSRNVSEGGFCVESSAAVQAGEVVELRVLGAKLSGTIRWARDGRSGASLLSLTAGT
jgi:hypothetical protein